MGEGKGLRLYMLIGAFMFGLFVGAEATAIFGDEVGSFGGGLVETVKDREPNEGGGIVDGEDEPKCVLAPDEDFIGTVNGKFRYVGSSDCVKIPHVIKGVEVTSYQNMFEGTIVSKVVSDNPNVTNMDNMFGSSQATEIDLSSFNTSNVTNMHHMFYNSQATELDVSSFDTSNVTNMAGMFANSEATEIDLSSFDTTNVEDYNVILAISQVKTVFARTQADADKFNASSLKPIGLQVIVKQ